MNGAGSPETPSLSNARNHLSPNNAQSLYYYEWMKTRIVNEFIDKNYSSRQYACQQGDFKAKSSVTLLRQKIKLYGGIYILPDFMQ